MGKNIVGAEAISQAPGDENKENMYNTPGVPESCDISCLMGRGAIQLMGLSGKATQLGGNLLDVSIAYSLKLASNVGIEAGINAGWTAFRDLANLVFIFVLLYIAIATILQLSPASTKQMLFKVILVGLLLNFSLFITQTVINASNVLGCFYYGQVAGVQCAEIDVSRGIFDFSKSGVAFEFTKETDIQTLYDLTNNMSPEAVRAFFNDGSLLTIGIFGSIFLLVLGFVFLMGAILFLMRSIALLFLMVLSPLAFVGFIVPATAGYAKQWWTKLFGYSFLAPIFLILIFVALEIMRNVGDTLKTNDPGAHPAASGNFETGTFISALAAGGASDIGIVFNFILVTGLVIAALIAANSLSTSFGVSATSIGRRAGRFGARGMQYGTRLAGSSVLGNTGTLLRRMGEQRRDMGKGGRTFRGIGNFLESRSYDIGKVPGADKAGMNPLKDRKNLFQRAEQVGQALEYGADKAKEDYDKAKGRDAKDKFFKNLSANMQEGVYKQMEPSERAELLAKDKDMRDRLAQLDDKLSYEQKSKTQDLREKKQSSELRNAINQIHKQNAGDDQSITKELRNLATQHTGEDKSGADLESVMRDFVGKMTPTDVAKIDTSAISDSVAKGLMKGMDGKQLRKFAMEGNHNQKTIGAMSEAYNSVGEGHPIRAEIDNGGLQLYEAVKKKAGQKSGQRGATGYIGGGVHDENDVDDAGNVV